MKLKSKTAPIHHPEDDAELREQIDELAKRFKVTRPHFHQIKVAIFNYFWSTEKITIDPCQTHPERGFDAFVKLIEKHFTKRNTNDDMLFPLPGQ